MTIKMRTGKAPPRRSTEWVPVQNSNGYRQWAGLVSYWRSVDKDEGVTVFETEDGWWKWVYDGEFSSEFGSFDAARFDAELSLNLD